MPEEEIVAEFLRSEFHHPEFDPYRRDFKYLVEQADLGHPHENFIRHALLFRRRGRLWRELPADTEWWEIELTARDLARLRSFPRNEWRRFAGGGFYLTEMVGRIEAELARGRQSRFLKKLGAIATDLRGSQVPNAVLLIGIDEHHPLTIIEGNHRIAAAMLTMPESAHRRFRFYCGLSPSMNSCCWHKTATEISSSRGHYGRSSPRWKRRENLSEAPRGVARDLWIARYESDSASVVAVSIELGLNTDVGALSQKTETDVIQRADGELVNALVGVVGHRQDTRAQVYSDNSTLKRKRTPTLGKNLNILRRISCRRQLHPH